MSLFDLAKGMAGSDAVKNMLSSESQDHPGLVGHALDLVNDPNEGGLDGLVQKFKANGLGDIVNSWIGSGANHPITADQIQQVLGQDRIIAIASKFGMSSEDASAKLAQLLPSVVDKLTPGGTAAPAQS